MYNLVTVFTVDRGTCTYDVCAKLTEINEYLTDTEESERRNVRRGRTLGKYRLS